MKEYIDIGYKFTPSFWSQFFKKGHYFKGSDLLEELKFSEYYNYFKNMKLDNCFLLKTDLYVEAKNRKDNFFPFLKINHCVGIDISWEVVANARKNLSQAFPDMKFLVADVRCLPFKKEIFDIIISDSTLDQIPKKDLILAFSETRRTMAQKGKFILSLINIFNYPFFFINSFKNLFLKNNFITYSFNIKYIIALLERFGFGIITYAYILPLECFGLFLIRLSQRIRIINPLARIWLTLSSRAGKMPFLRRFLCLQFIIVAEKNKVGG